MQLVLIALIVAGCSNTPLHPISPGLWLSDNLSIIKQDLVEYHDNGAYKKDLERVDAEAEAYLVDRATKVKNPALVLDIDETALSNWEQMMANDFAYFAKTSCDSLPKGPCGAEAYDRLVRATAITPTLKLAQTAADHHVAIFFITGRYEAERAVTEANLKKVGYPEWARLFMRPDATKTKSAADFKAPTRQEIERMGYTIIVNVGDQASDLNGGFAERAFLLADPFYRIP